MQMTFLVAKCWNNLICWGCCCHCCVSFSVPMCCCCCWWNCCHFCNKIVVVPMLFCVSCQCYCNDTKKFFYHWNNSIRCGCCCCCHCCTDALVLLMLLLSWVMCAVRLSCVFWLIFFLKFCVGISMISARQIWIAFFLEMMRLEGNVSPA